MYISTETICLIDHRGIKLLYDIENNTILSIPDEKVFKVLSDTLKNAQDQLSINDKDDEYYRIKEEVDFVVSKIGKKESPNFNTYEYLMGNPSSN